LEFWLKVPSAQIGSAWEWYHWIGREKDLNRYRFFYFLFLILNIWEEFKVLSRFMQKWIQPPTCLDHGLHVLKPQFFLLNRSTPKMRERHQLFVGLRLLRKEFQHPAIQTKILQHFGGFFHRSKVRQPIGRQDSMQTVIRTSRRLDSFLHKAAQNRKQCHCITMNILPAFLWPACKVISLKVLLYQYDGWDDGGGGELIYLVSENFTS
jgi:hypothetical protein